MSTVCATSASTCSHVDEVRGDGERGAARGRDLSLHLFEVLGPPGREHDRGALSREGMGVGLAETGSYARDDDHLAVEQHRRSFRGLAFRVDSIPGRTYPR